MERLRLLFCVVLLGCGTCASQPEPETEPEPEGEVETEAEAVAVAVVESEAESEVAFVRVERPATALERAQRVAALPAAERERLRTRSSELRRGRQLGRSGDHAAALAAFESALETAPTDAVVLCEAGFQALRMERWDVARGLLERGLRQPMQPRTRGACLYNLARVNDGSGGSQGATVWLLEQSLIQRENLRVEEWMRELEGALGEVEDEYEYELRAAGPDFDLIRSAGPYDDIQELARAGGCEAKSEPVGGADADIREVRIMWCPNTEERVEYDVLIVLRESGWSLVESITESDSTDSYGRLEAMESVASMRWVDGTLRIEINGGYDEMEGEADAYWQCEREFEQTEQGGDSQATDACFEAAIGDGTPDRWRRVLTFGRVDGQLELQAEETDQMPD